MRVLIVEDEPKLADVMRRALVGQGFSVALELRGDSALERATSEPFDAIVLDVMLPGLNGFDVCRLLRERDITTPVIMLTARGGINDRVTGFENGADDYLVKPFALRELYARLRALGRRIATSPPIAPEPEPVEQLQIGGLHLNTNHMVATRQGQQIELRPKECAVLRELMSQPGRVVSRFELLEAAWDSAIDHRSNIVDVQIKRLREKIDRPFDVRSIETLRGRGYRIVEL
ncbi:MAG: response regulator transcription factor [Thermoleophilia bacterium]|nr:response regulator transcription factor [Thermoleophilia bacterium]